MDKTDALNIVLRFSEIVKSKFDFQKIILFGSYTKGNQNNDSDIDVAIVFDNYENRLERQVELMKLTRKIDTRIEPHPFRKQEFNISNPMVKEIITYGLEVEYKNN
jgi:predicted nucleotidyltransferase